MLKSTKAGMEEIRNDIVGDLEEGFNFGDFFAKYGPALNEAIWEFGYGYGKNGLTNRHLLYMVYIVKKCNILNTFAAEIMEMTMVKGLYLLHEAILVSKPDITDKDGFFKKLKKYTKAAGKETMDGFKIIQGLFWIFVAGAVSDLIKEKVNENIFASLDEEIKELLGIEGDDQESIAQQEKNKDYTDSFKEIYQECHQQLNQKLTQGLANVKELEIDLGEHLEETFEDFIEKLIDRYDLIPKIFGADKAYTVYNMKNVGQDRIKVIKEEKIDGPNLGYGSKVVIAEGGMQWSNVKFFNKFDKTMESQVGNAKEGYSTLHSPITDFFGKLLLNTKAGNIVTKKSTQVATLATELKFLRRKIVFTDERKTKFEGLEKLHGNIDEMSTLVQTMFDNNMGIEKISDFVAYCDEESKQELKDYIRRLESNSSNQSSLNSSQRERYTLIGYSGERQNEDGEKEEKKIAIGYSPDCNKKLVEYVELLREKFSKLYQKTDNISLTSKQAIFFRDTNYGQTTVYDFFKVEKIKLEEVAKQKGVIELEKKRGRMKSNQSYIGDFISLNKVIKYNERKNQGAYQIGISPKGKGKLKINGQYLTPQNLTVEKRKKSRKIYELKKGDTLWDIAVEHYGAAKQWVKLEKENEDNFTEHEAKKLQVGTKVYIPQD